MTKEVAVNRMNQLVRRCGVNKSYIYIEEGVEVSKGRVINEVRLKGLNGVEFLERGTNKVVAVYSLTKRDMEKIWLAIS